MVRFWPFCEDGSAKTNYAIGNKRASIVSHPNRLDHGTLLIGVRAKDGVVIAADSKVMRGGEAHYADKIHVLGDVAFATEGLTGVADDFLLLLNDRFGRNRGFNSLYEAKVLAEDLVAELQERYGNRVGENTIGALVAGLENITSGNAKLYYLHSHGYAEAVTYRSTGSGGPYATAFVKFLQDPTLDVEENARRVAFVIHWVAEAVDTNVGGKPTIGIIRDGQKQIIWMADEELDQARRQVELVRKDLWKRLTLTEK